MKKDFLDERLHMGKNAFKTWDWARKRQEKILNPFTGGSGSAALANGFANLLVGPFTFPVAAPFFAVEAVAAKFFKQETQLAILFWNEASSEPTTICVPKVRAEDIQVICVPDGVGGLTLPVLENTDGWLGAECIKESTGIDEGSSGWICNAWDERRKIYVRYYILLAGTGTVSGAKHVALSELGGQLPEEALDKMTNHPNYFEHWKNEKFTHKVI